jgi:hypothetical protein
MWRQSSIGVALVNPTKGVVAMSSVMIRCPITGEPVSTEIEVEPSVFRKLPKMSARMLCPVCRQEHIWATGLAWLADEPQNGRRRTGTAG